MSCALFEGGVIWYYYVCIFRINNTSKDASKAIKSQRVGSRWKTPVHMNCRHFPFVCYKKSFYSLTFNVRYSQCNVGGNGRDGKKQLLSEVSADFFILITWLCFWFTWDVDCNRSIVSGSLVLFAYSRLPWLTTLILGSVARSRRSAVSRLGSLRDPQAWTAHSSVQKAAWHQPAYRSRWASCCGSADADATASGSGVSALGARRGSELSVSEKYDRESCLWNEFRSIGSSLSFEKINALSGSW